MRTRINNITFTPGTRSINTGITDLTVDDVRLFINESQMKVICSSMQKSNIDSIVSGVVTYKNTFPVLASGDHITFEVDLGDNVAKQGTNSSATLTATQAALIDGNDTAIGVSKEIRSEVGTGSDTAAETGTLFAVVKWVKDKVKSIGTDYAKQGSNANANISDIQALIGYTISEIDSI